MPKLILLTPEKFQYPTKIDKGSDTETITVYLGRKYPRLIQIFLSQCKYARLGAMAENSYSNAFMTFLFLNAQKYVSEEG